MNYSSNVFLNCPFDDQYKPIRDAIVFTIYDCGFTPRSALEVSDSGDVRYEKIRRIIQESRFGIHDISRTELDPVNNLPRFNMPLELGVFLGARHFGNSSQKKKVCLVLDVERYRYQKFISDISGSDISEHRNDPKTAISKVRNWLNDSSHRRTIPGGKSIHSRYQVFLKELPKMCKVAKVDPDEITYNDFSTFVSEWLKLNKNI